MKIGKNGLKYDVNVHPIIGKNNGMYGKSIYVGKSKSELDEMRKKKHDTFYAKPQEERDEINGTRGHGLHIFCITTNEWFKSVSAAARKYPGCGKANKCKNGECFAGMLGNQRLRWRLATPEENEQHKDEL